MRPFSDTGPIRSVTTVVSMTPAVGLERFNFNWSKTNIVTLLIKYFDSLNKFISFLWKISQHNIFLIKFIQNSSHPNPDLSCVLFVCPYKNKPCYAGVVAYDTSDFLGNMHIQYLHCGGGGSIHTTTLLENWRKKYLDTLWNTVYIVPVFVLKRLKNYFLNFYKVFTQIEYF